MIGFWIHGLCMEDDDMHEGQGGSWDYGMHKKATVHRAMELGLKWVYLILSSEIPCLFCCIQTLLYNSPNKQLNNDEAHRYSFVVMMQLVLHSVSVRKKFRYAIETKSYDFRSRVDRNVSLRE